MAAGRIRRLIAAGVRARRVHIGLGAVGLVLVWACWPGAGPLGPEARLVAELNGRLPGWAARTEPEPLDPAIGAARRQTGAVLLMWATSYSGHPPRELLGWGQSYHLHECAVPCIATDDRRAERLSDGLIFDLCHLEQLPTGQPRKPWLALAHEAPPSTRDRILEHPGKMALFNFSSTFDAQSDVSVRNIMSLGPDNLREPRAWVDKSGMVAYFASNCGAPSDRDGFVRELMEHVQVSSYGRCLHNMGGRQLPKENALGQYDPTAKLDELARFKFVLVLPNTLCDDYVDEKLEDAFLSGAVPVVMAPASIQDYEPSRTGRSMIMATDFRSPKQLAEYLKALARSEPDYREYLRFREQALAEEIRLPAKLPAKSRECFMCEAIASSRTVPFERHAKPMQCYGSWRQVMRSLEQRRWTGRHRFLGDECTQDGQRPPVLECYQTGRLSRDKPEKWVPPVGEEAEGVDTLAGLGARQHDRDRVEIKRLKELLEEERDKNNERHVPDEDNVNALDDDEYTE